ncbi:hypothetical protein BX600DRAFT_464749 [Xylariales sp. PMI_506]|nr:hypothetical protein BX600DRAFT_464749 [Xylariales sp. PMI_506]
MFNAYGQEDEDDMVCHPETRLDLLQKIQDWARARESESIFWLDGAAGFGKSTISRTFAKWLNEQSGFGGVDLGASFFFKRGDGDRGSASRFFPTVVRQLIMTVPELGPLASKAIQADPLIQDKLLGEQFAKLIEEPLRTLNVHHIGNRPAFVIVVDALDECDKRRDIEILLKLWSQPPRNDAAIRLKIFLTSRPELLIESSFKKIVHKNIVLHNEDQVPRTMVQHDITVYMKQKFAEILKNDIDGLLSEIPSDISWPDERDLQDLVSMAMPLFIMAATICRFVADPDWNPRKRLQTMLQHQKMGQMQGIEATYISVLKAFTNSDEKEILHQQFRVIVGSIIILAEPLSSDSLVQLLGIDLDTIIRRLRLLRSVLHVPDDQEKPVRTLHLSFREFMLSGVLLKYENYKSLAIDGPTTHRMLGIKCIDMLTRELHEDMCYIGDPGKLRGNINSTEIDEHFSPALRYACQYWIIHMKRSIGKTSPKCGEAMKVWNRIHLFFQKHFLHWLEALILLQRIDEVIGHINSLKMLATVS